MKTFINVNTLEIIGVQYKCLQDSTKKSICESIISNITSEIKSKSNRELRNGKKRIERKFENIIENTERKIKRNFANITRSINEKLRQNLWLLWGVNAKTPNVDILNAFRLSKFTMLTSMKKRPKVSPVHGRQCEESSNSGKREKLNFSVQTVIEKSMKNSLKQNPTDEPKSKTKRRRRKREFKWFPEHPCKVCGRSIPEPMTYCSSECKRSDERGKS